MILRTAPEPVVATTPGREPPSERLDLLRIPLLGRFLRWRWSRVSLQVPVLLLSILMAAHALLGPQLAPKNLGTLITWVHFRGLAVLVLLLAGNFFCMACPFMLPRAIARKFFSPSWNWPRPLRNKLPAVVLFVLVLFSYELFDLWSDPFWTGVLIVGFFASALLVDSLFRRASFCKYVCPIGQFNFLGATLSPLEVAVRDYDTCVRCTTKDCIRGQRAERPHTEGIALDASLVSSIRTLPILQRGCELALFQPRKVGNLDCTFCLDCVYACPHDNVGILTRMPAASLPNSETRSGIGSLNQRGDWTVLMVVFIFGALLNAFAMTSPVYVVEQAIASRTGLTTEWPILGMLFMTALVIEPVVLLGGAAALTRRWTRKNISLWAVVNQFTRLLVPLGFGVWLAHYGFHFFTGALTVIPVLQNACLSHFGSALLGDPQWQLGGLPENIVFPMEIGFLGLGLLGSLLVGWRIAADFQHDRPLQGFLPWAGVSVLLFAAGCWILTQPMDMRGTFLGG